MLIMLSIMAAQFAHYLAHGSKASIKDYDVGLQDLLRPWVRSWFSVGNLKMSYHRIGEALLNLGSWFFEIKFDLLRSAAEIFFISVEKLKRHRAMSIVPLKLMTVYPPISR